MATFFVQQWDLSKKFHQFSEDFIIFYSNDDVFTEKSDNLRPKEPENPGPRRSSKTGNFC